MVGDAEDTGLPPLSVDLVVCSQAAHWFDLDKFFAEVDRILKPNGVLALSTYQATPIASYRDEGTSEKLNKILKKHRLITLAKYWDSRRSWVENGYADIHIPYKETLEIR
ncbi:PREDICTED: uncharacterized methyltransferase C25B8.09-like [Priapulus caudatus]|uniref:Uncharacterized methyltransferase C25B8.09-like n=1 Tax=Priapulus caudatus TaxID=37621 RepID=A0ABM1FAM9_PRICU|nr:PREDICTED: uncharacterized methyltransferase C25B8.09-like [Priapulus caudatus]